MKPYNWKVLGLIIIAIGIVVTVKFNMRKKIAIIGGSYLQLPAVLKAHKLGLEVHCFSWEEGAVCAEYADYFIQYRFLKGENIICLSRDWSGWCYDNSIGCSSYYS